MDLAIFEASILRDYVTTGIDTLPYDKKINIMDANSFTLLRKGIESKEESYSDLLKQMFDENSVVVIPEMILVECERNFLRYEDGVEKYEGIYKSVFQLLSEHTEMYVVSFRDMEKILLGNNGNNKALSLSLAKVILEELFPLIQSKLKDTTSFDDIEAVLTEESKNAGERVIVFFAMLFLSDFRKVDVLTDEAAVYTQRYTIGRQDRLIEVIGATDDSVFFDCYNLKSFDSYVYNVLLQKHLEWSTDKIHSFITNVRRNRNRKVSVYLPNPINYSFHAPVNNNQDFEEKSMEWIEKSAQFLF
ncbi:hypothetical protein [Kurthia sibirica]|uniref:Uncharacterized protein n=1 Tax=Kurthia sibirica TaxID=202750 RepID=A0A2U3AKC6_9BACL|nr:hypothetical protein [Kurthia sibirica]PWI24989.1 hypothetical protein DEX24_10465 [Kurthia sibirica]GEK33105.1 hypothetical protein KSI01_06380 [Kurthia sibirica]